MAFGNRKKNPKTSELFWCLSLLCFLVIQVREVTVLAKVFDMTKEKKASYFEFTGSPAKFKQDTFKGETPSTTMTYDNEWKYNYSGEVGFFYSIPGMGFRFAFEVIKPDVLKNVVATVSASTDTYQLTSTISGYAPKFGIEMYFYRSPEFRFSMQGYYGNATVTYKNEYSQVSYAGVTDHSIEAKGSGSMYGGGFGIESFLSDTTTFLFSLGYRSLKIDKFEYSKITPSGSATFSGTPVVGDAVLKDDGLNRSIDFSGYTVSMGFRFYL